MLNSAAYRIKQREDKDLNSYYLKHIKVHPNIIVYIELKQGSYMQVWVKFKDFSKPLNSFQGLKVNEKYWSNTVLKFYFRNFRLRNGDFSTGKLV